MQQQIVNQRGEALVKSIVTVEQELQSVQNEMSFALQVCS